MDLCEWDAKALLRDAGLPVPGARLVDLDASLLPQGVEQSQIIKAQMLQGGRGKAGLVRSAGTRPADATDAVAAGMRARGLPAVVMLEDAVVAEAEWYIAIAMDDLMGGPVLMFSAVGGVDVEGGGAPMQVQLPPDGLVAAPDLVAFFRDAGAPPRSIGRLARLAADLHRLMREQDALLVEINPLGLLPSGRVMALDAKITLDDSAAFRRNHARFSLSARLRDARRTTAERRAHDDGYVLVETPGTVVLLTAGAGLGMYCSDLLADAGLRAATFFDNAPGDSGQTADARLDMAWELAARAGCRAIAMYLALASRDLAPRVLALAERLRDIPPPRPFYFGLTADAAAQRTMSAADARALIAATGYPVFEEAEDMVAAMHKDMKTGRWLASGQS